MTPTHSRTNMVVVSMVVAVLLIKIVATRSLTRPATIVERRDIARMLVLSCLRMPENVLHCSRSIKIRKRSEVPLSIRVMVMVVFSI